METKLTSPVGREEDTEKYCLIDAKGEVWYFASGDGELTEDDREEAQNMLIDQGGTLYRITVHSVITAATVIDGDNTVWVEGGMVGNCPVCGEASGFHSDEGDCETEE